MEKTVKLFLAFFSVLGNRYCGFRIDTATTATRIRYIF